MKVIPDEIYPDITLNEKDDKVRTTLSELEIKFKRVLTESAIKPKNLTVTYVSSDFHKRSFRKDSCAVKIYELKLQSVAVVNTTLTHLKDQGIWNISISHTDYSKREEAKQALRLQVLKEARQKAEALLQTIGYQIGKTLSISAQDYLEASPLFLV